MMFWNRYDPPNSYGSFDLDVLGSSFLSQEDHKNELDTFLRRFFLSQVKNISWFKACVRKGKVRGSWFSSMAIVRAAT